MPEKVIEGQLNGTERQLLVEAILTARKKPEVVLEIGTWLGGGSTLHILRAIHQLGSGHLWGIEADNTIYERMIENLRVAALETLDRFTPLFGFSQDVIPRWLQQSKPGMEIDFVFLDGGNNPREQITEFLLLDPRIPVGGQLMAHDARLRKGKWLVPYISRLDNWQIEVHDVSDEGLLHAKKLAAQPSLRSLQAAQAKLFRMRLQPVEIAAAMLPRRFCRFVFRMLPSKFSRSLADGRK